MWQGKSTQREGERLVDPDLEGEHLQWGQNADAKVKKASRGVSSELGVDFDAKVTLVKTHRHR